MHDYTIDEGKRRRVIERIVVLYCILVFVVSKTTSGGDVFQSVLEKYNFGEGDVKFIKAIFTVAVPTIGIGVFYYLYNKWIWKWSWVMKWHGIPNLNGVWNATVKSGLKDHESHITMNIRQTWNMIQVTGISTHGTRTASETASIMKIHGSTYFSYSYWIHNDRQWYPGFNSLLYQDGKLCGDYFSDKNLDCELQELLGKISDDSFRAEFQQKIRGCGSKGKIEFVRASR